MAPVAVSPPSEDGLAPQPPISLIPEPDTAGAGRPGGIPPSFYDDLDPAVYLGPAGVQATMVNKQGLKLKTYSWPAKDPKCVLLFVHGHGAYLHFEVLRGTVPGAPQRYDGSWAESLNAAGISVCGLDNQGCGLSEGLNGLRFYVESFDDYVDDVLQLAAAVAGHPPPTGCPPFALPSRAFAGLPTFLSGISLGGCIVYNAADRAPADLFRGVVFLAPMLSLERASRKGLNPYLRPLSAVLSLLVPTAALVTTDRNTKYPDIQVIWDQDPLTAVGKTRVRNANEYLRVTEQAMATLGEVEFPFIVFHSENDTMCDSDGSKQLYLRAKVRFWVCGGRSFCLLFGRCRRCLPYTGD